MDKYEYHYRGWESDLEKAKIKAETKALCLYNKKQYNKLVNKIENQLRMNHAKIQDYKEEIYNLRYTESRWESPIESLFGKSGDDNSNDLRNIANFIIHALLDTCLGVDIGVAICKAKSIPINSDAKIVFVSGLVGFALSFLDTWAFRARPLANAISNFKEYIKEKKIDKIVKKQEAAKVLLKTLKKLNGEEVIEEEPKEELKEEPKKESNKESKTKNIYDFLL